MKSIRGRFLLSFFILTVILFSIAGILLHKKIYQVTFDSIFTTLNSKINIVSGLLEYKHNNVSLELEEFLFKEYIEPKSGHYYKIVINNKEIIYSPSLVDKNFNFRFVEFLKPNIDNEKTYQAKGWNNENLAIFEKDINFHGKNIVIYIAENIDIQKEMIQKFDYYMIILFIVFFIFFSILVSILITISLKPIESFTTQIKKINHNNLNKIDNSDNVIELQGLSNSFNDMIERLKKSFETERVIISETSHKLKTPVSVIITSCDIVLQKVREKNEYIETINTIKLYGYKLSKLISDILSLAHLDSGRITSNNFEKTSLVETINIVLEIVEFIAIEKYIQLNFNYSHDIYINLDKDRFIEALLSITENAIKYNKNNGSVEISISTNNNFAVIQIKDSGIGISEDDLKNIFERFYRANDVSQVEGSGLGLNIAKTIIEAHEGKIEVSSKKDQGTIFSIYLPITNPT